MPLFKLPIRYYNGVCPQRGVSPQRTARRTRNQIQRRARRIQIHKVNLDVAARQKCHDTENRGPMACKGSPDILAWYKHNNQFCPKLTLL